MNEKEENRGDKRYFRRIVNILAQYKKKARTQGLFVNPATLSPLDRILLTLLTLG